MAQLKDFQTGAVGDSFNGPIGTSTAAAGAFTTLAASGAVTLSGGTANGVTYLNGSKVLTSGSALTFDGTNVTNALGGSYYAANSSYGFGTPDSAGLQIFTASGNAIRLGTRATGTFTELARLDATGLGIGTSSPKEKLDSRGAAVFSGDNATGTNAFGTAEGLLLSTGSGVARVTAVSNGSNNVNLALRSLSSGGAVNALILNPNGAVALNGAVTTATGVGITFPATQSASSDANTLDDYEEGTWTPSIGGTATYSARVGTYTKIGRQVTAWFDVTILLRGTGGNALTGLPFTQNSAVPGCGNVGYFASLVTNFVMINPIVPGNTANVTFEALTAAGNGTSDNDNIWANSARCTGFVTYHV
jgi:hypothetical protein